MLEHFFGSATRVKILQIFFRSPERAFYVRELSRLIDTQLNGVRREIANLEMLGLLEHVAASEAQATELGTERSKYYQLKTDSLLFPELKALLLKAELLEEQALIEAIKNRGGVIKLLILTGSFTGAPDSETDLLLVGECKPLVMAKLIRDYEEDLGRPIRYTIMDEKEFKDRREIGDKFIYGVFESRHITAVDQLHLGV